LEFGRSLGILGLEKLATANLGEDEVGTSKPLLNDPSGQPIG